MISYTKLQFNDDKFYKKQGKKNKPTSDTIYTFDIEVSSLFKIDGVWRSFDYSKDQKEYAGIEKCGIPYIFMFGVNDVVYYGRDFKDFKKILLQISDPILHKVIYVFNLSYEFQFLLDIFEDYTIDNMVCRDKLKPISFNIKELNIEFRCAYMLTNMSLENSAEEYGEVPKLSGTLDYLPARGKETFLSDQELLYCEYDIKSLYSVIKYFLNKYDHIANIPLTCTGEVRKALKDHLNYWYFVNNPWKLVPNREILLMLRTTFAGGYTHSNMIKANRVLYNVKSKDIASSYPAVMVTEQFPCGQFKQFTEDRYNDLKKRNSYAWFFEIHVTNCKSRFYNHYVSYSKIYDYDQTSLATDNGRVVECNDFCMWCTDIDLEIIKYNYNCDVELLQIYGAPKNYLDIRIINFILDQYAGKTAYKGVEGKEDIYRVKKIYNNSVFGMTVTDSLKNSANYGIHKDKNTGEEVLGWYSIDMKDEESFNEFVDDVIEKQKKSYSNIMCYATGLWVTSYARRNCYMTLLKLDKDSCYMDTDSIKYVNDHEDIFEEYNKNMLKKYETTIKHYPSLKLDNFMPIDKDGIKRPIGFFEDDGEYEEFITLGAKKYAYRDKKGLHITVSGVSKDGATALKDDISNFKKGFKWGYHDSGKLTHVYLNDQKPVKFLDKDGKIQYSDQKHGVVLQPTTYTLGLTSEYESLIKEAMKGVMLYE